MVECRYYHRVCPSGTGCPNVQCRAFFPQRAPIIQESMKPTCMSEEYLNCPQYEAGNEYREKRIREKIGCPFLTNSRCGKPNEYWCKGFIPPFVVTEENNLEACKTKSYELCPNYAIGVKEAEEARRLLSGKSKI